METIHRLLAYGVVALTAIGLGWAGWAFISRRPAGPAFERLQAGVVALIVVAAASGLTTLVTGSRPSDGLHLLYAVVAVLLIPLARSFAGPAGTRIPALLFTAFVVLGAVMFRLFATG